MNPELLKPQGQPTPAETPLIGIGEFLVQENFITPLDCKKVLNIQEQEERYRDLSLFRILTQTKCLSPQHFTQILLTPHFQSKFIAVIEERQLLPTRVIDKCISSKEINQTLPEYIVSQGLTPQEVIDDIIFNELGDAILVAQSLESGYITSADITFANKLSKGLRNFGDICCDLNLITPLDLYYILLKYDKQTKFGDILLRLGYLDEISLQQALAEQQKTQGLLGNILVAKQLITAAQCQEALSIQANIPFDPLTEFTYDEFSTQALPQIVSPRYAEKNLIIPIRTLNNQLTLALMQPEAINAVRELGNVYKQFQLSCILTTEQRFMALFHELYGEELVIESKEQRTGSTDDTGDDDIGTETDFMQIELDEDADDENKVDYGYSGQNVQTEEIVNYIIKTGIKDGASDIHIEQDRGGSTLRFRVDGVMKIHAPPWLDKQLQESAGAIISRIKVISNLDIAEKRMPQDGVFRICYFDKRAHKKHDLDFRVATCPAITGENVTIRILDSRKANVGLDLLGHRSKVLKPFKRYLGASAGLILVTGPTGSGKSSTLYGALQHIYDPALKIITAEDPIEYSFKGIMQTQVNQKINLTFARLMRSFLRLDPDVILVGEIRDEETATIAFDAAQTGHLVLSTLHTNDSVSAVSRLLDLNIDRSQIAASLSCILAQRLVRKICSTCITEYHPERKEWDLIFKDYPQQLQFFKGAGCPSCDGTGYKGRTLLSEVFTLDDPHAILQGASIAEIKKLAIEHGMQTMLNDGLDKLSSTTLEEICRVLPFDMLEEFRLLQHQSQPGEPQKQTFWLEDPAAETELITEIHSYHEALARQHGLDPVERELFGRFITEHFEHIRAEHNCPLVQFHIAAENGKIAIHANPGDWVAGETNS